MTRRHLRLAETEGEPTGGPAVTLAFASTDYRHVDQHFGLAAGFVFHRLGPGGHQRVGAAELDDGDADHDCDRLTPRIELLDGCAGIYCIAVGPPAVRRLLQAGIQPRKVATGTPIEAVLGELGEQLQRGRPPAWLQRALGAREGHERRFDAMETRGWR